jgi:hypothetical protein
VLLAMVVSVCVCLISYEALRFRAVRRRVRGARSEPSHGVNTPLS